MSPSSSHPNSATHPFGRMAPQRPERPARATLSRTLLGKACCAGLLALASTAGATDLLVRVVGLTAPLGQVGCSLFSDDQGFPMDNSRARVQWLPAQTDGATCRFSNVAPGRYAVSIGHDRNGNQRVDTNFIGLPTEPWGVSNNARPTLRAPRFDEAAFSVPSSPAEWSIEVRVAP